MDDPFLAESDSSDSSSATVILPAPTDNFHDDFLETDFIQDPLSKRLKGIGSKTTLFVENAATASSSDYSVSWQNKFCIDDFCEDSNELPGLISQISQSECGKGFCDVSEEYIKNKKSDSSNCDKVDDSAAAILKQLQRKYRTTLEEDADITTERDEVIKPKKDESPAGSTARFCKDSSNKRKNGANKVDKELAKEAKKRERELKRLKSEQEKAAKNALKVVEKSVKPDECLKYITTYLDNSILSKEYSTVIRSVLENGGYNFKFVDQPCSNIILWSRTIQSVDNFEVQSSTKKEKYGLLILESKEFIEKVSNNSLTAHLKSLINLVEINQLSVALFGLEHYYSFLKNCRKKEFQAEMGKSTSSKNSYAVYNEWPKIDKAQIEMVLIEMQIFCKNCYIRYIEKYEDLAFFVMECTKAVAQIPYKSMKQQKYEQENEFFGGENKKCVAVDKNGNGLGRLWSQILTLFPLASLEVAEAITSVYPTPHALISAYKKCHSTEEKEKLLQDISIRRAAGPLSAGRRIGPELSKKVNSFVTVECRRNVYKSQLENGNASGSGERQRQQQAQVYKSTVRSALSVSEKSFSGFPPARTTIESLPSAKLKEVDGP